MLSLPWKIHKLMVNLVNTKLKNNVQSNKNVHIGEYTYGNPKIIQHSDRYHVYIGKFCSIANGVKILVDGNHRPEWVTTFPFYSLEGFPGVDNRRFGKGDIVIGNDVWIGMDAFIMPGIQIGDGAVIGANAVVTKSVGDYEIVAGNPAKHIRYRFNERQIKALKTIKWWDWDVEKIKQNVYLLESTNIDIFIDNFLQK